MNSMKSLMQGVYRVSSKITHQSEDRNEDGNSREAPALMRRMENASAVGKITGHCGETMEIYLRISGEQITDSSFYAEDGCLFSMMCGAVAANFARNRNIDDAAEIDGEMILEMFKSVPKEESHCAYLAAETLQAAIHDWMIKS